MARRGLTDFGLAPVDIHVPRDETVGIVASRNMQNPSETNSKDIMSSGGRQSAPLHAICALHLARGSKRTFKGKLR